MHCTILFNASKFRELATQMNDSFRRNLCPAQLHVSHEGHEKQCSVYNVLSVWGQCQPIRRRRIELKSQD